MNVFLKSTCYPSFHYYNSGKISKDGTTGVIDKDLHVHGLKNVMVVNNSAIFNQSLGAGPAGQLTAFGFVAGKIIKERYGKGIDRF
jgi:choline dehydrogenase-like flavoprotein